MPYPENTDFFDNSMRENKRSNSNKIIIAAIIGPIALFLFINYYISYRLGQNCPVYLINGLDRAYHVEINGIKQFLPSMSHIQVKLPEEEITIKVLDEKLNINEEKCVIKRPMLIRPFINRTFVINPDRVAILMWEQTEYAVVPNEKNYKSKIYVGDFFYTFNDIDYEFTEFPKTVELLNQSSAVIKQRLSQLKKFTPSQVLSILTNNTGIEKNTAKDFLQRNLNYSPQSPQNEIYLYALSNMLSPDEYVKFLRVRLMDRPILVDWHRMYQTTMERFFPDYDIHKEYKEYLEKEKNNSTLIYLLGRVTADYKESEALFYEAIKGKESCPNAYWALVYRKLSMGQFKDALKISQMSEKSVINQYTSEYIKINTLWAMGEFDKLLKINEESRKNSPYNGEAAVDEIQILIKLGNKELAEKAISSYCNLLSESKQNKETVDMWRSYLEAVYYYTMGDVVKYSKAIRTFPGERFEFEVSLSEEKIEEASKCLEKNQGNAYQHLLVYIGGESYLPTKEISEKHLKMAIDILKSTGEKEEKKLAGYLEMKQDANADEILDLTILPDNKRTALVASGIRFPKHREKYFKLAEKLNYNPIFPYLFIKKVIEKK